MKVLLIVGVIILVLGVVSLFVPFPHTENHGVNAGPMSVNIQTKDNQKLPPALSAVLIIGGIGMSIAGARSKA
jgi:hypothetical protein